MNPPFRVEFRGTHGNFEYKTLLSAAADVSLQPGTHADPFWNDLSNRWEIPTLHTVKLPTGLFIVDVDREPILEWNILGFQVVPCFHLLPRSSLVLSRLGCELGTIEVDYENFQIYAILDNKSGREVFLSPGDRIGQLKMDLSFRIPGVPVRNEVRTGGFGSTGR